MAGGYFKFDRLVNMRQDDRVDCEYPLADLSQNESVSKFN